MFQEGSDTGICQNNQHIYLSFSSVLPFLQSKRHAYSYFSRFFPSIFEWFPTRVSSKISNATCPLLSYGTYDVETGGLAGAGASSGPGVLVGVGVLGPEDCVSLGAVDVVVEVGAEVVEGVLLLT